MDVFFCRSKSSRCNGYLLGNTKHDAVLIDPGHVDINMLNLIEENNYHLHAALITHDHKGHTNGLRCLTCIYDIAIYAANKNLGGYNVKMVREGEALTIGDFVFEIISVPGHSQDSVVYKIEQLLFTGDVLGAGFVGRTTSMYGSAIQMTAIRNKLFTLPYNCMVFPGHGPPTSLEAERLFNSDVQYSEYKKKYRPRFLLE
ncbi:MAG: MBL fold metallo-hydrolase [Treponema sp.]|jgi:glyoxylase-like metal-dependent hydrolase (beta-lactamase superfamily II)|nr:MBL fold metallo-hydrolase [Treponema sp.]